MKKSLVAVMILALPIGEAAAQQPPAAAQTRPLIGLNPGIPPHLAADRRSR